MSSLLVADLTQLMTPSSALQCAEYCFQVSIDFSRRPKDDKSVTDLKRILTSLLNTSGGIICISSYGVRDINDARIDMWKRDLEGQLTVFIPTDVYQSCIKLVGNSMPLYMIVKKSHKLITLNSNLSFRQMAGNSVIHDSEHILHVMNLKSAPPCANPLFKQRTYVYGSRFEERESQNVEFKYWKAMKNVAGFKSRIYVERIRRSLFSMPNMPSGGYLILGIEEDDETKMNIVLGQAVREQDEIQLRHMISDILVQNGRNVYRIWGSKMIVPTEGEHYTIDFIPVTNCPDGERRRLICVHFKHCSGGVFELPPESYYVTEDGFVAHLAFQDWKAALENSLVTQNHQVLRYRASSINSEGNKTNQPSPTLVPKQAKYLSWVKNRACNDWDFNMMQSSLELDDNVLSFIEKESILSPSLPFTFTPSKDTIRSFHSNPDTLGNALDDIERHACVHAPGFAIVTSEWLSYIQLHIQLPKPDNLVMNIFLMDTQCNVHLWSIINESNNPKDVEQAWEYTLQCGRLTKRNILLCDQDRPISKSVPDIHVQCYLYSLTNGIISREHSTLLPQYLDNSEEKFNEIQKKLAFVLLSKRTYIRSSLGNEYGVYLTSQQMEKILMSDYNRFNFIEGAPGSGKTYLALHLCSKYEPNKVAYVCTTRTFENYLIFQRKCHPIYVQNDDDLNAERFSCFDCIIIDDAHNLSCSDFTWISLFMFIHRNPNIHLFIFADSRYQNFKAIHPIVELKKQMQRFCDNINIPYQVKTLSVVHRNTKKVVSFMKYAFEDKQQFSEIGGVYSSHPESGDDVEIRKMGDVLKDSSANELVVLIKDLVNARKVVDGRAISYQATDIAILVDTNNSENDAAKLRMVFPKYCDNLNVHSAGRFPLTGLTIDILDNFVGFDRQVCIFVMSEEIQKSTRVDGRSLNNPAYKAFLASRCVSKVIFIVSDLNIEIAIKMKLNRLYFKATKKWSTLESEEIRQMAYVKMNNAPVILYINSDNKLNMMSCDKEKIQVPESLDNIAGLSLISTNYQYNHLILVHRESQDVWRWSVFKVEGSGLLGKFSHLASGEPAALCWTPNHAVIMLLFKFNRYFLSKYSTCGDLIWEQELPDDMCGPMHLVANHSYIYIADHNSACIHEFNHDGSTSKQVSPSPEEFDEPFRPHWLCLDSTEGWLLLIHEKKGQRMVSILSCDGKHMRCVIMPQIQVLSISVYKNKYMAIGSEKGLLLYDMEGMY